ncbi:PhzF family phenazine biosynthesis isomerase [Actinosynnema sp. NPDC047251]|uniref:Phenazine biosynthesis protein, PhzF family n=1 Tax=Saccharothrix espanaensis (strain ATCC 51144 / DSM 44229 / JCM 9112 / NBRC 15066 / NRRL 15764) TaxID=1179773 RepID=K0JNX2_SACES|nr:PhzF family phenazine biosynthesis isomerase [Saccharothrix espanaensis]CCH27930.1 Phenazine biosynthesis protein, PhzF family [Saccharothrix espanaensis DSM 44229]
MTDVLRYTAFTTDPAGGNPAGVVLDATGLDDAGMLAIAAEVGYSETAFVLPHDEPDAFHVRYYSPEVEVPFCGHATVATAVAMNRTGTLAFHTRAGRVAVDTDGRTATLTSVPTSSTPVRPEDLDRALDVLRWERDDLDPRYPAHWAFGGARHLVLAVKTRERLAHLDYDFDGLRDLLTRNDAVTAHLVHQREEDVFDARDPFPVGGVVEDAATGAAALAFGGYLRTLGLVPRPRTLTIHQGVDLGRPSLLSVDVRPDRDQVRVTGAAVPL